VAGEEAQLQALIDRRAPEVAATTRKALAVMRKRYPGALQLVFENRNRLAVGFGPKPTQAVLSIVAYPRWVTLFFLYGIELDDPHGLLEGSGNQVRSIRLDAEASQLNDPRVKALLAEATKNAGTTLKNGEGRVILKSIQRVTRPTRP